MTLTYKTHGVDLAFAITVWKSQGKTIPYVLMLLNPFPHSHNVSYEKLYVMASRAPSKERLRCFPIPNNHVRHKIETRLRNLRPNIWATKWRMDIDKNGMWKSKHKYKPKIKVTKKTKKQKTIQTKNIQKRPSKVQQGPKGATRVSKEPRMVPNGGPKGHSLAYQKRRKCDRGRR